VFFRTLQEKFFRRSLGKSSRICLGILIRICLEEFTAEGKEGILNFGGRGVGMALSGGL